MAGLTLITGFFFFEHLYFCRRGKATNAEIHCSRTLMEQHLHLRLEGARLETRTWGPLYQEEPLQRSTFTTCLMC